MFTVPVPEFAISLLQVLPLVFVGLTQSIARADGFRDAFQSAAAIAQGNAFAAHADDASAVFYNPAGMTNSAAFNMMVVWNSSTLIRTSAVLNGRTTENDLGGPFGFPPPLQMFITARPKDRNVSWLGDLTIDKAPAWHHLGTDLAYHTFLWETRKVLKNPNPSVNGTYRSLNQALALSLRIGF